MMDIAAVLQKRVTNRDYSRREGDRMPRANEWRPYRFAIKDVVFNIVVMRHSKELNAIEVDLCLTAEITGYPLLSGAKAAALMILSEAFRVGAPMKVVFTGNVEPESPDCKHGSVPAALVALAAMHGISLSDVDGGIIRPDEGRQLYAALTGFPDRLRERIDDLETKGLLSMDRACYMIHHGVWTVPEVEGIIAGSPYPDLVMAGDAVPEDGHLYRYVQTHARAAVLGGYLDRCLLQRSADATMSTGEVVGQDEEDDERNIEISFEPECYGRCYVCPREDVPLPAWPTRLLAVRTEGPPNLPAGERLVALLRPRDAAGLRRHLQDDLVQAGARLGSQPRPCIVAVLVPFDWFELPTEERQAAEDVAERASAGDVAGRVLILVCPETTRSLDADVQRRLSRSRVLRD